VHPSLLPRWRGPDPCFWAIDSDDAETGVTAHRLDAEYDTGAMLGRARLPIDPSWDAWALARALDRPSLTLLRDLCRRWAAGESVREEPQRDADVTHAPAPDDALLELDWTQPASAIAHRVRAAAPYPGAWTFLGDEALVVTRAVSAPAPKGLEPGEAAIVDGVVVVACADGGVALRAGRRVADDDREEPLDAAGIAELLRLDAND
jgi:methionyl-tRNA formyltransferase